MKAMVLEKLMTPLVLRELETPEPKVGEALVRVKACGVCPTDV